MGRRSFNEQLRLVQAAMDQVPGFLQSMANSAEAIARAKEQGEELYRKAHWGQRGKHEARISTVPDASMGVIDLGYLVGVQYLTKKGRERQASVYDHTFEGSLPLLCFAANGSGLVIVRDRSDYTVTERGIEG